MVAQNTVGYVADTAFPQQTATSISNTRVVGPSFTITASAGAGGTITPTGTVTVGRGGSQTFTITPNAGFRDRHGARRRRQQRRRPCRPARTPSRTCRPTHTISATFTQSQATITSSAGTGGSISPNGAQTVAIGGSQTYTITPNNGYVRDTVLVDGVNDPAAVTSGTYTFTNVTANHTIARRSCRRCTTITVTAPTGTTSQAQGSSLPVTWTTNAGGRHAASSASGWSAPANGWYVGKIVAADGSRQLRRQRRPRTCPSTPATASSSTTAPPAATPGASTA